MAELRRDPINGRWVIIATDNPKGPETFSVREDAPEPENGKCPFCYGNESMTPPEVFAHREGAGRPDTPGWSTRIVPNKFPALQAEGEIAREGIGMFDMMNGFGAHEVIIETPDHNKELSELQDKEVERVVWAYRNRSFELRSDSRFRYMLIFKNRGRTAGASLAHPHTQLIALPMVPKNVLEEIKGAQDYYEYKERCVFCDINRQEKKDARRIVAENDTYLAFCPFVSRFPFECWISPKRHFAAFDHITIEMVADLARILKETLARIRKALDAPPYNFIIHTSPIELKIREEYHWHMEIMPRLSRTAGFEWGTGFYINPTPPELAAEYLRKA